MDAPAWPLNVLEYEILRILRSQQSSIETIDELAKEFRVEPKVVRKGLKTLCAKYGVRTELGLLRKLVHG